MDAGALRGRVAIVTGAGRGLGREIARAFARAGARLSLAARSGPELRALALELEGHGTEVLATPTDVAVAADVRALVDASLRRWGKIDILVNNAGINHGAAGRTIATILDVEDEFWDLLFATNCRGPFMTMKAVLPEMVTQGSGVIINIGSMFAHQAIGGIIPYGPSKAALETMTLAVAAEFGSRGIRANVLHPGGAVDTGIFNEFYRPRSGSQLLSPEIIGPPAVWLASDASAHIQGQVLSARTWSPSAAPGS